MGDRVPLGPVAGLISPWVAIDQMVAPISVAYTVTRVFLSRTDVPGGGGTVTAIVTNATGGAGANITASITGTDTEVTVTGSLAVLASEACYLRVTAADAESMNLRGWFEIMETGAGVSAALTNLAKVRAKLDDTSADEPLITQLIGEVSDEIQSYLDRRFVSTTATAEAYTLPSQSSTLVLRGFPVVSFTTITEDGTALAAGTDYSNDERTLANGLVVRLSGGAPMSWSTTGRGVVATYDHGYSTVPAAVCAAATDLVAHDYLQAKGKRFGLTGQALGEGGDSGYRTRNQLWAEQAKRLAPYSRRDV